MTVEIAVAVAVVFAVVFAVACEVREPSRQCDHAVGRLPRSPQLRDNLWSKCRHHVFS